MAATTPNKLVDNEKLYTIMNCVELRVYLLTASSLRRAYEMQN